MTAPSRCRLGVDFGTSTTVAMLQRPDGRTRPLLFDGSPLLTSAVLLGPEGELHTGRDVAHLARRYPERMEPNPKRRIDDGTVLLGDRDVAVPDLIAAVLRRVAVEADRVAGPPDEVILTHPVQWGMTRRALLVDAAQRAGLVRPRLAPEPVGAATYFAQLSGDDLPPGADVLVYDLGAGTCDVTLLRRRSPGFEVIASAGLDDVGGLDIDAAIVDFLRSTYGQLWHDGASQRQLWDEVRTAKEMLSRSASTIVTVPALGMEVPLGRAQFDELAQPVLAPTISLVKGLLDRSGTTADRIAGMFLVGGSSRIPLVGTLLHQALGVTPTITEQPELVVAEGALALPLADTSYAPDGDATKLWPGPVPAPAPARSRRTRVTVAVVTAVVVAFLAALAGGGATLYAALDKSIKEGSGKNGSGTSPRPSATGTAPGTTQTAGTTQPTNETAAQYQFADVGPLCPKVTVAPLKAIFETQEGAPDSTRSPGSSFVTASCIISLTHVDSSGLGDSIVTVHFNLWVFKDGRDAVEAQKTSRDNASENDAGPTDQPGIGDEAFTYRKSGAKSGPSKEVEYTLEVRDANLRWIAGIRANRIASGNWSPAQRTRIEKALLASAKQSYGKATA